MEFQDVVRRRRMVRDYADTPVDPAIIDRALENATHAPSAGRPEDVRRFWAAQVENLDEPDSWLTGMMRAPVVILPCSSKAAYLDRYAEPDKGWTDRDEARWPKPFWDMDAAMASLLILQTATDAGLGACFFGVFREDAVRAEFEIPERYDPVGVITLGHRTGSAGAGGSPTKRPRTPWTDVVHRGQWGHQASPSA
jgi:nitroreductase